jgi:hypothetical protein
MDDLYNQLTIYIRSLGLPLIMPYATYYKAGVKGAFLNSLLLPEIASICKFFWIPRIRTGDKRLCACRAPESLVKLATPPLPGQPQGRLHSQCT